jgi:hypothetical protein
MREKYVSSSTCLHTDDDDDDGNVQKARAVAVLSPAQTVARHLMMYDRRTEEHQRPIERTHVT